MPVCEAIQADVDPFIVGVISDTHVPDRVNALHPHLIEELRAHQLNLLLHGGDISSLRVLDELKDIAPLLAVTGNRDFFLRNAIPNERVLSVYGSIIAFTHGHLDVKTYWKDKVQYSLLGYDFERYHSRLSRRYPQARVIIFGHTHHPENCWIDDVLYFNPGSVSHGDYLDRQPNYGILKFYKSGRIEAKIIPLTGARISAKRWG